MGSEKEMATHSSILVWEIPWTEEPDGIHRTCPWGHKELDMAEHTHNHTQRDIWTVHGKVRSEDRLSYMDIVRISQFVQSSVDGFCYYK